MPYRMFRVFCATPGDPETGLEPERHAFHDAVGEVNEAEAMAQGILFVPVSVLPQMVNFNVFRPSLDENVRACKFYVQVLQDSWGLPTRSFEPQYQLAMQCCAGVSIFFKSPNGMQVEPAVAQLKESQDPQRGDFENLDDFKASLRSQLSAWLETLKTS
jgi:hypothetical protein